MSISLKSIPFPEKTYIGFTQDLEARLLTHNSGKSLYTSKYRLWLLVSYTSFNTREKAANFEKFLKSGSGTIFVKKHYL